MQIVILLLCLILGSSLAFVPMNILKDHKQEASGKKNNDLCNPNLLYDATVVYSADVSMPFVDLQLTMEDQIFEATMPRCARKYKNFFGVDTEKFWKGVGPLPNGWTGFNITTIVYRLYGLATPEYIHHFPITNGRVFDDTYFLETTMQLELGGEYGQMMQEMGMSAVVPNGTVFYCGQYRLFENDTNGMYQLAPPIKYFGEMPMMPMFTTADMSYFNSITMINCVLESDWWGPGLSTGLTAITFNATTSVLGVQARNTLVFPASIQDRQYPPRYRSCEPLPPSH